VAFLLDTNIVSELRKTQPHPRVAEWYEANLQAETFVSCLVIGEIRSGIERLAARDVTQARGLEAWLGVFETALNTTVLPITAAVADRWGRIHVPPKPIPIVDGLMAATALVHGLTFVTRNTRDVARCGVSLLNPFSE
jgi:predicted nucleic acid-binding protein